MSKLRRIRVLSVDDHPLLHEGLATVLRTQLDMLLVGEASSGREAIQRFRECRPDITLMDLQLPDMCGIDLVLAIRSEFPQARIIILTTRYGDVEIQQALKSGARSYIFKSMPPTEVVNAIRQVHAGKTRIPSEVAAHLAEHYDVEPRTVREVEILRHLPHGNRTRDIAEKLFIAEETVKCHIKHIKAKLGAVDRTQAVANRGAPRNYSTLKCRRGLDDTHGVQAVPNIQQTIAEAANQRLFGREYRKKSGTLERLCDTAEQQVHPERFRNPIR